MPWMMGCPGAVACSQHAHVHQFCPPHHCSCSYAYCSHDHFHYTLSGCKPLYACSQPCNTSHNLMLFFVHHAESPEVALQAVPALAQLFSAPLIQAADTSQHPQTSTGPEAEAGGVTLSADAAALQLEALQVLLLLLPLPQVSVHLCLSAMCCQDTKPGLYCSNTTVVGSCRIQDSSLMNSDAPCTVWSDMHACTD